MRKSFGENVANDTRGAALPLLAGNPGIRHPENNKGSRSCLCM